MNKSKRSFNLCSGRCKSIGAGLCLLLLFAITSFSFPKIASAQSCIDDGLSNLIDQLPPEIIAELAKLPGGPALRCKEPPRKSSPTPVLNPAFENAPPEPVQGDHLLDEVLVSLAGGQQQADEIAQQLGLELRSIQTSRLLGTSLVRFVIPDGRPVSRVLGQVKQLTTLSVAVPNHIYRLRGGASKGSGPSPTSVGGPPRFDLKQIGLADGNLIFKGNGIRIGVIDTAVDQGNVSLKDVIAGSFDALKDVPVNDTSHGTAIAMLISGRGQIGGISPEARLYCARAFDHQSSDSSSNQSNEKNENKSISNVYAILNALEWLADKQVQLINMSFAGPRNDLLEQAMQALSEKGIHLIAAAGNEGKGAAYAYPAANQHVLAVTATDRSRKIYRHANQGDYIFISAPGVDLFIPAKGGALKLDSGTSYSAALLSGSLALMLEASPGLTSRKIETILTQSATDLGKRGRDKVFGVGLLNVSNSLALIAQSNR